MGPAFMRRYGVGSGADIYLPMIKAGSNDFAAGGDWTPATGDVKISIDGGSQADINTLPVYSNGSWKFVFTNGELTGKKMSIRIVDTAVKAVEDQAFEIETFGHASAWVPTDLSASMLPVDAIAISGDTVAADNFETMLDGTGGKTLALGALHIIQPVSGSANLGCVYIDNDGNTGTGITIRGGDVAAGINILGGGAGGVGVAITGGQGSGAGIGLLVRGAQDGGKGLVVQSQAANSNAVEFAAHGSGLDLAADFVTTIGLIDARLPAAPAAVGDVTSAAVAILASIAALNNVSSADVVTAVTQVMRTDSGTELTGVPDKDAPMAEQLQYLFMTLRNGYEQTPSLFTIFNDAGVAIGTASIGSAPGLLTRAKMA